MPIRSKSKSVFGHRPYRVKHEVGSTRTITPDDFGCIITNTGGGTCTHTLPTPIPAFSGCWVMFAIVIAGDFIIDCATADVIIADNDVDLDSVTISTDNLEIGCAVTMFCTGTKWATRFHPCDEAAAIVVAD